MHAALLSLGGLGEEHTHRVEIVIGAQTGLAGEFGVRLQALRPARAVPERPEHLLGGFTGVDLGGGPLQQARQLGGGINGPGRRPGQLHRLQEDRVAQRLGHQQP